MTRSSGITLLAVVALPAGSCTGQAPPSASSPPAAASASSSTPSRTAGPSAAPSATQTAPPSPLPVASSTLVASPTVVSGELVLRVASYPDVYDLVPLPVRGDPGGGGPMSLWNEVMVPTWGHQPRRWPALLATALLLAGCASPVRTPSPPPTAAPAARTAAPTITPTPTASPFPSPSSTRFVPTPAPATGWPTVSRAGVTMTGTVEAWDPGGRLRLSISVTGLAPGEAVSLSAAGGYHIQWICGTQPEPCGPIGCGPAAWDMTEGTAKAAAQAVAGTDGTVAARVALVAAPPAGSCPADSSPPWSAMFERWEKVSITDSAHDLLLTPDTIGRGFTF